MIKEAKNVDFYTAGRQPSEQDFAKISEWIKRDRQKQEVSKKERVVAAPSHTARLSLAKSKA